MTGGEGEDVVGAEADLAAGANDQFDRYLWSCVGRLR